MNPTLEIRENLRELLARVAMNLDDEAFDAFLADCNADFTYRVVAHSPELGLDMVWLDHDLTELKAMLKMVPQHVRMAGRLVRHLSTATIRAVGDSCAEATARMLLVHTDPEGISRLLAVGTCVDTVAIGDPGALKLTQREVRLDTRDWNPGLHVPI